jgi:hypothetical protein
MESGKGLGYYPPAHHDPTHDELGESIQNVVNMNPKQSYALVAITRRAVKDWDENNNQYWLYI